MPDAPATTMTPAQALAEQLRATAARDAAAWRRSQLRCPRRQLDAPPWLPAAAVKAVEGFNAEAAALDAREAALHASIGEAALLLDGNATGEAVAKAGHKVRVGRFALARADAALAARRGQVLGELLDFAEEARQSRAEAVQKVREAVGRKVRAAGHAPEDDPRFAANHEAAERRFNLEVMKSGDVREAAAALAEVEEGARRLQAERHAILTHDAEALAGAVEAAWRGLAGNLL
ncbi:MAG TPA: hypothetical protein VMW52_08430 [Phycisphaerae bacterium]|nr:hypothetical protein [Phycisphaerae bacterium]